MTITDTEQISPLVSVIMPTYNHARFIGDAIKSVLDQTYRNFELIIIDNYSQDGTEEAIRSFGDERIKYYKFRNNGIIAASRNYGMKRAGGAYIAFLDSDDSWLSFKLKLQVDGLDANPAVGLVYTKCHIMKDNKIYRTAPAMNLYSGYAFYRMILMANVPILTAMIRREVVEKVGFFDEDARLVAVEDWDYWIRLSKIFQVMFLNEPSAVYREHLKGMSNNLAQQFKRGLYLSKKLVRQKTISRSQSLLLFMPGLLAAFYIKMMRMAFNDRH